MTFRIRKGWRTFFVAVAILLCALFVWVGMLPFLGEFRGPIWGAVFLVLLSLVMNAAFLLALVSAVRGRLVLSDDYVELTELATRRLNVNDIQGYRLLQGQYTHYVVIYPKGSGRKPIKISSCYERIDLVKAWASQRFADLSQQEQEKEEAEILRNEELGLNEEQRRQVLQGARHWCRLLTVAAAAASLWGFVYPRPYRMAIIALVSFPVIAIVTLAVYKGVTRFDAPKHSAYPTVATAFAMPPVALVARAFLDWNLLDYHMLVVPVIAFSAAVAVAAFLLARDAIVGWGKVVAVIVFALLYGYGASVAANCLLDKEPPERYEVTVREKRVEGNKHSTHYLTVTAWGDRTEENDVVVSKRQYERAEVGAAAVVHVKPGLLHCRWYVTSVEASQKN